MEDVARDPGFAGLPGFEATASVLAGLAADRISVPTSVQREAFGPILEGRNVVVESGTGTGKTLAYLLPLLQRLGSGALERVVCIAPTTELAMQTLRVAERYKDPAVSALALVTQGNQRLQASRLQRSTRLVVGTPERILEMVDRRKLKGVGVVVLDEPEPILSRPDSGHLREVLSRPEPKLQLVLVGATFGERSERWIQELLGAEAVRTRVPEDPLTGQIGHFYVRIRQPADRDLALSRFLSQQRCRRAIVFVNQPPLLRHLYRYLSEHELRPASVSHERSKLECRQALLDFEEQRARVLLTTDLVAPGLDLPGVDWVLHYDLPTSAPAYVHRAGRTGRAGRSGKSVVFVSDPERPQLKRMEKELGFDFLPFVGARR